MARARRKRVKLVFPVDFVIAETIEKPKEIKTVAFDSIPDSFMGLEIGTETVNIFSDYILGAGTIYVKERCKRRAEYNCWFFLIQKQITYLNDEGYSLLWRFIHFPISGNYGFFYHHLPNASNAGSVFPLNSSKDAPPPVETCVIFSLIPNVFTAAALSPPPTIVSIPLS